MLINLNGLFDYSRGLEFGLYCLCIRNIDSEEGMFGKIFLFFCLIRRRFLNDVF